MIRPPAAVVCPHCGQALEWITAAVLGCPSGHRFDVARQGYVALLGSRSRTDTGDTADMVAARLAFLAAGHFRPIADAVTDVLADALGDTGPPQASEPTRPGTAGSPTVLEIGAGTGYYLSAVLNRLPGWDGIAIDSSRFAARRSAADARVFSIVADAWSALPIRSAGIQVILSVFAPRNPGEVGRILAPGGLFVAVTPEPDHLEQLRRPLSLLTVDGGKAERLAAKLPDLPVVSRSAVGYSMHLNRSDMAALVRMGPTARHLDRSSIEQRVDAVADPTEVTASVTISVLRRP